MKGYKGFNKGLICRDKQYAENAVFKERSARMCHSGMHFCKNPFDVLLYYPFINDSGELSEYAEVEALDKVLTDDEKKYTTKKLKIGTKLGIDGLIKAFVDFTLSATINKKAIINKFSRDTAINAIDYSVVTNLGLCSVAMNSGDYCAITNAGDYSIAANTGDYCVTKNTEKHGIAANIGSYCVATNTEEYGIAENTGMHSAATSTGKHSVATNTGYCSIATNMGEYSITANTGNRGVAMNVGDCGIAINTGICGIATTDNPKSFAINTGISGKVKGSLGCYIACAEWKYKNQEWIIKSFKTRKVDGKIIKADTYYTLKGGKFIECN